MFSSTVGRTRLFFHPLTDAITRDPMRYVCRFVQRAQGVGLEEQVSALVEQFVVVWRI